MKTEYRSILRLFLESNIECILIGGVAANLHGSPRNTQDIDFVYSRTPENLKRIVDALSPYQPYLRGAIPNLPFLWDTTTLRKGLNFTLTTSIGDVDLLGEVTAGGRYEDLLPLTETMLVGDLAVRVVQLPVLIKLKRAAGRPKDLEAIAELELLRDEKANGPQQ